MSSAGGGLVWLGVALLLPALAIWMVARRWRVQSGLPPGRPIYLDHGHWIRQEETLYSHRWHLVGRPDYLVEQSSGEVVPVELKSGPAPAAPYESHVLQLAAYCHLVEEVTGVRPGYGILQYADRAFAVDYTASLERALGRILEEMRAVGNTMEPDRDHEQVGRCAACGVRNYCDQRLD
ncbi:MAG: CRISPR-associated protein Cas4 [Candidatus Promineifilaceae bacterium]|nr:CRISPR-associated protein Cas4 [Candidatus Promineifilaceae bacterium]